MRFIATLISLIALIFCSLLFCSSLAAQTFRIVPSTAPRGGSGSLLVAFVSPAGKEPIALQWKIALGTDVAAAREDLTAGDAATQAGKMLTCGPAAAPGQEGVIYNCILAGGNKAIANGTIFLVKYKIKPEAKPNTVVVRVSDGIAVPGGATPLREAPLAPVEGTITIR
jgi:hypothetical protein